MSSAATTVDSFVRALESRRAPGRGDGRDWLGILQQRAGEEFSRLGLPTKKDEAWRYTDLRGLGRIPFAAGELRPAAEQDLQIPDMRALQDLPGHHLVLHAGDLGHEVSGFVAPRMPGGVRLRAITDDADASEQLEQSRLAQILDFQGLPFIALNTASFRQGIRIDIEGGVILDDPLYLAFVSESSPTPLASHPRVFLTVGEHAKLTLVESFFGSGNDIYLTNAVTEISLAEGATLEHVRIHQEGKSAYHISTTGVSQSQDSVYESRVFSFGSSLTRHEVKTFLREPGATASLSGLALGRGKDHLDSQTLIEHRSPGCRSRETYKTALDDRASSVFNGRVIVHPGADQTDAKQQNHNLLLSDSAVANTKPQLEIFADDVKCTHGATVGQLDDDAVHYLRSRGVGLDDARAMLVSGFANEIVNQVRHEALRRLLHQRVGEWLGGKGR